MCVGVGAQVCRSTHRSQKRASDPRKAAFTDDYDSSGRCWELNLSPVEEQPVLLTAITLAARTVSFREWQSNGKAIPGFRVRKTLRRSDSGGNSIGSSRWCHELISKCHKEKAVSRKGEGKPLSLWVFVLILGKQEKEKFPCTHMCIYVCLLCGRKVARCLCIFFIINIY